jgi:geranylgeranyl pyrophosphate synthase
MGTEIPGGRATSVLDWLDALVDELPVAPAHAALFRLQIEQGREQARSHPVPAADLPVLTHAAVTGEPSPPPLAGACLCVYLGADLLDNVVDQELPEDWQELGPTAATLTAVTFLALVWKALGRLREHGAPAERIGALTELFADRLLAMSSGEIADLQGPESLDSDAVIRIAEGKSGTQFALYARAGAMLAGAPPEAADAYSEYGSSLGTASQLMSDLADVCQAPPSDDLRNGALTLPVIHGLASAGRERLEPLLQAARTSDDAQEQVRTTLIEAGAPAYVAEVAGVHRERGLQALESVRAREPAAGELRRLLDMAAETELVARARGRSDAIAEELQLGA